MKALSIKEQINACIRHANRNNLSIDSVELQPNGGDNHQVIVNVGGDRKDVDGRGYHRYISVAVLINIKNNNFLNASGESTWDIGRN